MPKISIIVPCYNEQATIRLLLEAIYGQTYPRQQIEVIIADAMSTDRTRQEIAAFGKDHADLLIKVVDNPQRTIPAALNQALAEAGGEIIVRLDAHCAPRRDYVERCVTALEAGLGENVGGVWDIQPGGAGWMARAIAVAAAHPLGVGDAQYRFTNCSQEVDTVPFGCYRRDLIARIGAYDETLLANEDYEFNARLRQADGRIWLDATICSTYYARSGLGALARQYWRYGFWKVRMLQRYPATIRWRQALPPLFVLSLLVLGLLALLPLERLQLFAGWLLLLEIALYGIIIFLTAIWQAVRRGDVNLVLGFPLAVATMHLSWGSGFLWSLCQLIFNLIRKK